MTNGRIDTRCQLLSGVVDMLAGMNGQPCSKSASLSISMACRTSATWEGRFSDSQSQVEV